jgi:hypothetical protein
MGQELGHILSGIREVSENLEGIPHRLAAIEASAAANTASINELYKMARRPGMEISNDISERKSAAGLCVTRHNLTIPKNDGSRADYVPASSEIDEAVLARKAVRSLFRLRPQRRVCIDVNPIGSLHRRMAL